MRSVKPALAAFLIFAVAGVVSAEPALSQSPVVTPSPAVTATVESAATPFPTASSEVTPAPSATPAPTQTATALATAVPGAGTIRSQLVEDLDGDGQRSNNDAAIRIPTLVELVFWSRAPEQPPADGEPRAPLNSDNPSADSWFMQMLTAADGSFSFDNVPPGNYTLRIWWAGGFVGGAMEEAPDQYRAIIEVQEDGRIGAPAELPPTWPGSYGYEINLSRDNVRLGQPPDDILLNRAMPNVVPYPVSFGEPVTAVGRVDVAAALARVPDQGEEAPGTAALPDSEGGNSSRERWILATVVGAVAAVMVALWAAATLRARRR
jgi:hypothetical protein